MNAKRKTCGALILIFVLCTALLCAVNAVVGRRAAEADARAKENALRSLLPAADHFTEDAKSVILTARDAQENVIGYVAQTVSQGYSSEIETTVACTPDGKIAGVQIGGENFAESQGLGDRVKEAGFTAQFAGKTAPVRFGTGEGCIDAVSSATITSSTVLRAVNDAADRIAEFAGLKPKKGSSSPVSGEAVGSAQGVMGPVAVKISVKDSAITSIEIGDKQFAETAGLGSKVLDSNFKSQFIGKKLPMKLADIDAVSGATITSQAVVDAVNTAYATLDPSAAKTAPVSREADGIRVEATGKIAPVPGGAAGVSGEAVCSVQGKYGPAPIKLGVYISVKDGVITEIELDGAEFMPPEGVDNQTLADIFKSQFIGAKPPMNAEDIDAVSGASVTRAAVVDAVNAAYASLSPSVSAGKASAAK